MEQVSWRQRSSQSCYRSVRGFLKTGTLSKLAHTERKGSQLNLPSSKLRLFGDTILIKARIRTEAALSELGIVSLKWPGLAQDQESACQGAHGDGNQNEHKQSHEYHRGSIVGGRSNRCCLYLKNSQSKQNCRHGQTTNNNSTNASESGDPFSK